MPSISEQDVKRKQEALVALYYDVAHFGNESGMSPDPGSLAAKEQADSSNAVQLSAAYSGGTILLVSAADHALALTRLLLVKPVLAMAPYTCVRGSLESAALSRWLLSNRIDSRERIGRSFAFRFEGLSQQLKLARAKHDTNSCDAILSRMDKLDAQARSLGYGPVVGKKGNRIGIAQRMPSATECIRKTLDEEWLYRILSAMAHGQTWAQKQLSFHVPDPTEPTLLKKTLSTDAAAWLLWKAADTLAKPVWTKASLFGHDLDNLSRILETRYREMGLVENRHFWVGEAMLGEP